MRWNLLRQDDSRTVSVNFRAVAILAAVAGALVGGVCLLHGWQIKRHTPLVLQQAQKQAAAGETASAIAFYETYLGYRPDDAEAIADHAVLKAKIAKSGPGVADAFFTLLRAVNKCPERDDVRRELVSAAVRIGRIRDCPDELERLLKEHPDDRKVLELAAHGAVQLEKPDDARLHYERLIALGQEKPETHFELIRLLSVQLKDDVAADAAMARLLKRHPDAVEVRIAAAAYYLRRGDVDQTETQVRAALNDLESTDPALYRLQAEIARLRRRPFELADSLQRLSAESGDNRSLELELAETELTLGRRHAGQERLLKIARDDRASAEEIWQVITLLADINATDDESDLRDRLRHRDEAEPYLESLAMLDRLRKKDWGGALDLSRGLLKTPNLSPRVVTTVSMWRAECYEQLGQTESQIAAYRRAIGANQDYLPAHSRLARVLFRSGKLHEAQGEYAWLIQQQPAYAREFVTELTLAQSPESTVKVSAAEVERLFAQWRQSAPNDPMPVLCQLDLFRRLGAKEKIEPLIAQGIRTWPAEAGFRIAQIDGLIGARNWDAAWSALDDAESHCGLQPPLLVRRVLCVEGSPAEAQNTRLMHCAEQFTKLDRDGQAQVLPILMRGLQRTGVDAQAIETLLTDYGDRNPGDALAQLALVQRTMAAGASDEARRHLEILRENLGEESPAYALASLLYDVKAASGGDTAALHHARSTLAAVQKQLPKLAPQWLSLKADLDLLENRPQDALASLQAAIQGGDGRVATLSRTLELMVLAGRLDETVPYLKSLTTEPSEKNPADTNASNPPAGYLPVQRDLAALRDALETAVTASWPVALAAARADLDLNQPDRAAEDLQHALQSASDNPLVWANWLAYLERYRPEQLDKELLVARDKLSVVDRVRLLPDLLLRHNRREEADALVETAGQEAPNDPLIFQTRVRLLRQNPKGQDLEKLLRETAADPEKDRAAVREVARRELARTLAATRDYRKFPEAMALSDEILAAADRNDVEALRVRADVCIAHPGHWKDALVALKQLEESALPTIRAEAFSEEARVQERRRHWDEEAAALAALSELGTPQPQLVLRRLLNAVRRKDKAAAKELRERLTRQTEDANLLLGADVLLSTLNDDHAEVVSRVLEFARSQAINSAQAIEWLAVLKADDACIALLKQQLDPEKPQTVSRYIQFLARHNRISDAMAELSRLWKSGSRDAAVVLAASLTAVPDVSASDLEPVRTAVLKVAESDGAPPRVLLAAAMLEDHAGRHAEAMALYRRVVTADPDNVVALNNLAFMEAVSEGASEGLALQRMHRALELAGPNDQLLDTEGVALLRRGDAEAAADRFQRAWDQRPEPGYQVHLAWALIELARFEAADEAIRKADAADPPLRLHPLEKPLDAAWRARLREALPTSTTAEN